MLTEQRLAEKQAGKTDPAPLVGLEDVIRALRLLRERAETGGLSPSEGNLGLGFAYTVSDWGEPLDSDLRDLADDIEGYYQKYL